MTSPSGDIPPRPETNGNPIPPRPPRRDRSDEVNLWDEDESETPSTSAANASPPVNADNVWSRNRPSSSEPAPEDASDTNNADDALSAPAATVEDEDEDGGTEDTEDVYYAEPAPPRASVRVGRVAWELAQTLVLAALIFLMVRGVAQNFRVEGPSMEPGLHNGQYLLVNKAVYFKLDLDKLSKWLPFIDGGDNPSRFLFHGPERGDVVVFRYPRDPSRDFIKRIIGVPGDTVSIEGGTVTVNDTVLTEDYINPGSNTNMDPKVVPAGSYFVMGDNRPNSSDSRNWGFVPEENIIGKAMFSYWPMSDAGGIGNTTIDLGFVKIPLF